MAVWKRVISCRCVSSYSERLYEREKVEAMRGMMATFWFESGDSVVVMVVVVMVVVVGASSLGRKAEGARARVLLTRAN